MGRSAYKGPGAATCRGFSLIELVAVMVLVSILSIFAASKMTGTSGYDEYIVRDQLISALRFAQQHAMYDQATGHCYRVNITAHRYAVERSTDSGVTFNSMNDFAFGAGDTSVLSALDKVTLPIQTQRFDGLGNPVTTCGGVNSGSQTIDIKIGTTTKASLCILSTGHIRAC